MKPIDFRNQTFADLKGQLVLKREAVWLDWMAYELKHRAAGFEVCASTTREVCTASGRDILQFRPRCTELYQMGVLMLVNPLPEYRTPREGRYRLRSIPEWEQWFNAQRAEAISGQQQLL